MHPRHIVDFGTILIICVFVSLISGALLLFKFHLLLSCCLRAVSVYIQKVFRNARWLFNTPVIDIPRGYRMVQVCRC